MNKRTHETLADEISRAGVQVFEDEGAPYVRALPIACVEACSAGIEVRSAKREQDVPRPPTD